jgi:hypothetical protein
MRARAGHAPWEAAGIGFHRRVGDTATWLVHVAGDALSAGRTRTEPLSLRRCVGESGMWLGIGRGYALSAGAGHGGAGLQRGARHGGAGLHFGSGQGGTSVQWWGGMVCGLRAYRSGGAA